MNKEQDEKSFFIKSTMLIFAILTVLSLVVSGCTSKLADTTGQTSASHESINPNSQTDDMQVPVDTTPTTVTKDDTVIAADNKSEIQKTQEQLSQVIADGTYDDQVTYRYHSGTETIDIKVTVENDVVTAASITSVGDANPVSLRYINGVNDALPDLVIGKKIDQLNLPTQISGSSLTTAAFKKQIATLIEKY